MLALKTFSKVHQGFLDSLMQQIRRHYGKRLVSLGIFGSYARGTPRLNSDLDLFIVLKDPPPGRLRRTEEFVSAIEGPLDKIRSQLEVEKIFMEISTVLLSKKEADRFLPLYLDMVDHFILMEDDSGFLKNKLREIKEKMKIWGSKKREIGGHWYWEIKPGLKYNEVFDYDQ